jgi:nucleoside-diphosphate-sugar epimerase
VPKVFSDYETSQPFIERVSDNEGDLVLPAIGGVKAVLSAAAQEPSIKRVAITSSVAAVMDLKRQGSHIYTASDWSPMSYAEAIDPKTDAFASHRGSKKFAELAAWDFMRDQRPQPSFELVTLCPPLIYGPMVHPRLGGEVKSLNSSNGLLWKFATGEMKVPPGPGVRFWVDVRDLATAHVEAVRRSGVGGRRFVVASVERARYETAGEIIREGERFGAGKVSEKETMDGSGDEGECEIDVDGWTAERELGIKYRSFRDSVGDLVGQVVRMRDEDASESLNM